MDIHYADKAYRRRSLLLFAAIVALCIVLLWQLHAWLQDVTTHLRGQDPATVRSWLRVLFAGLGIALAMPAIGLGLTLRRLAQASRLQQRFPPMEWKTFRDVRVLRDAAALNWARRVDAGAKAALALAGALIGWALWAWWRFG
ncbi:MAG TPA: hypothetical protein VGD21_05515 [Lysobacter sp.]